MVGDLEDEYRARPPGPRRTLWFAGEAAKLAVRYLIRRERGGDMDRWFGHIRFALRRVLRDPGYAVIVMGTMALGTGATVAIFSVVDAVLLRPLPYHAPDRLVSVFEAALARDDQRNVANPGNVRAWREGAPSLSGIAGISLVQPMVLSAPGEPREILVSVTTPDFFRVLGLDPVLGPGFDPQSGGAESGNEAILSYRAWQEIYGGAPDVVGRTLTVNGTSAVVAGVLPVGYVPFGEDAEMFVAQPLSSLGDQTNTGRFLYTVARLAPGADVRRARDELEAVAAGLREQYPDFNAGWSTTVVPLQEYVVGDVRSGLWVLLGAVGLLLLVACANVANLGLARATDRKREMAIRTSLGASGGALARQLLTESALLVGVGGLLGLVAAETGTRLLAARMPDAFALPRVEQAGVDLRVLLFALGVTVLTGILVGLVPALQARRLAPAATLNAEGRGPGHESSRVRDLLVVGEMALSVVLLVGAGLLARSFMALVSVDSGIRPENVVTARVNLTGPRYDGREPDVRFYDRLAERLSELPGVEAGGGVTFLPMAGSGAATSYYAADKPEPPKEDWPVANIRNVVGDYFQAMGIDLLQGRLFDQRDRPESPRVIVVNRALAEQEWPGENPIGKPLAINWTSLEPWTVVGVVEDVRLGGLEQEPTPTVYHAYAQAPYFPFMTIALRTRGETAQAVTALRALVRELDPALPLSRVAVMDDVVARSVARPRMTTFLMGVFAAVASALAAVGLYGILSYNVARRGREFGVRMAMGADRSDVLGMVARRGLLLAVVGLLVGAGVALAGAGILRSLLYQTPARDPVSFALAGLLLMVVAGLASLVPAWRATRVQPVDALRSD